MSQNVAQGDLGHIYKKEVEGGACSQWLVTVYVEAAAANMFTEGYNVRKATAKYNRLSTSFDCHSPHNKPSEQSVFLLHSRKGQYFRDKNKFKNFIRLWGSNEKTRTHITLSEVWCQLYCYVTLGNPPVLLQCVCIFRLLIQLMIHFVHWESCTKTIQQTQIQYVTGAYLLSLL